MLVYEMGLKLSQILVGCSFILANWTLKLLSKFTPEVLEIKLTMLFKIWRSEHIMVNKTTLYNAVFFKNKHGN